MSKKLILITSKFHDMTNNKPWQTIVNANNFAKGDQSVNTLSVVKKAPDTSKETISYNTKVVLAKRYSLDDNGGGYQGL